MQSFTLLTDLYQLTMAYGYWKLKMHEREAVFHLSYRKNPYRGGYALAAGVGTVLEFLERFHFTPDDLDYLRSLVNSQGSPLFEEGFLAYLAELRFSCDLDAIPEGSVVAAHEPLLRIKGPLLQGQLLESPLLNIINFQTLIATKASRICRAAQGDEVVEFGLRRAQGANGALAASRAAYIGGCVATSNTLAGKLYGIPVRGTHAHSWVTAFADEQAAFEAYAQVMPHQAVLLVDTYDTQAGIQHAIEVGKRLREKGADLLAIRLDSGDMGALSIEARKTLDAAGFHKTQIMASNSLDEYAIANLKAQGAKISIWGVGTNLVTSYDQPALDGVYKLSMLRDAQGQWEYKLKLSEDLIKISNPGFLQVRRFYREDGRWLDLVYDQNQEGLPQPEGQGFVRHEDLLQPFLKAGQALKPYASLKDCQQRAQEQLAAYYQAGQDQETNWVALEKTLFDRKQALVKACKTRNP